jgi:hypothetical protein
MASSMMKMRTQASLFEKGVFATVALDLFQNIAGDKVPGFRPLKIEELPTTSPVRELPTSQPKPVSGFISDEDLQGFISAEDMSGLGQEDWSDEYDEPEEEGVGGLGRGEDYLMTWG